MELLPRITGTRPRLAVELRPEGVVAARAEDMLGAMISVAKAELHAGALLPGLKAGSAIDRSTLTGALRKAVDAVTSRSKERARYVTLVVPDAAARILLLDFDTLPGKPEEALAVVRFRLKKLLPFDAEHAVVSYQQMSAGRNELRVLAIAMPCDVLSEYESLVMESGYLAGAVLPSTLALLAGIDDAGEPSLVVNAGRGTVTTAIVHKGALLLHRTLDLDNGDPGLLPAADLSPESQVSDARSVRYQIAMAEGDRADAAEALRVAVSQEAPRESMPEVEQTVAIINSPQPLDPGREVAQAISVAAAYFEDTLGRAPDTLLSAGTVHGELLQEILTQHGLESLRVREIDVKVSGSTGAIGVRRGWLAGVQGALRG